LRWQLVVEATAVMRLIKDKPTPAADWIGRISIKASGHYNATQTGRHM